ncbi:helix-turn-helix domain-containing protein [Streptomyces sp. NBC_00091]|uniref:helix-turn-helix domain-containing protein n=1 Tax=Streptomyces sp. NBC_00091 TaxID=2975648 RepID=UPI00224F6EB7|nr:helix-turn-helix domain-containing protein [Streptomyces sp. NBC_00091]MCX5378259.1 helix-turn-helix domain-containing protein [Streptomyces sp. NBC_00091]
MEAPPPTPPPTPPVALAALLADRELGLRLLAGPDTAEVHGVHASEMTDPSPYLLGGELLLTAGGGLGDRPGDYVSRLVGAGAAALGFGVAPVHEEVPAGLAEACGRFGLPLLEVPSGTPFTAVARTVWRLMAEARTRELRRVTEAQQSLAAAAGRPDPVGAVLSRLAASLSGWAGLLAPAAAAGSGGGAGAGAAGVADPAAGAGFRVVRAAGGGEPGAEARAALEALAHRVAPGPAATATDTPAGTHLAAYAVGGGQVLALATGARAPGDHTIASVAAVLLSLLTAHRPAGTEAAALTRLLLDGDPAAALAPGPWYAVHARGAGDPQALAAALGTVLLDPRGPAVRLLTDREPGAQPGWRLGVSAAAAPGALTAADAQAGRALERAEAARTPVSRHTDPGFAGLVGEAEARAHAEALLGPLSPALRGTLRGWLAHHGSWDRSAAALGVHRNTVRQRVARCAALLDRDLDDPDTRMELWFALRRLP